VASLTTVLLSPERGLAPGFGDSSKSGFDRPLHHSFFTCPSGVIGASVTPYGFLLLKEIADSFLRLVTVCTNQSFPKRRFYIRPRPITGLFPGWGLVPSFGIVT
jgi:hypothetical protein